MELKKLLVTALALWVLAAVVRGRPQWITVRRNTVLMLLAFVCVVAWSNFGRMHGRGRIVHRWEHFHYFLGSKYFPELGYDGLYAAAALALKEQGLGERVPDRIRDQRTLAAVSAAQVLEHGRVLRAGFTDQRWESFKQDVAAIRVPPDMWLDHGYNPTPAWTFTGRLLTANLPVTPNSMRLLAAVDFVLYGLVFWLLWRTYGLVTGCCALIIFGLNYNAPMYWTGGALLRQDWLAALTLAICMLTRERFAWAGAGLAYAAAVRVFPVIFLLPLGIYGLSCFRHKLSLAWLRPFALGFSISGALMFLGGVYAGGGSEIWADSAQRLRQHQAMVRGNDVGIQMPFVVGLDNLRGALVKPGSRYDQPAITQDYVRLKESNRWLIGAAALAMTLLAASAVWRVRSPADAALLGLAFVFALSSPTCYYWVMLLLLPLRAPLQSTLGLLRLMFIVYLMHAVMFALFKWGYVESYFGMRIFAPVSAGMAILFVYWLLPGRDPTPQPRP